MRRTSWLSWSIPLVVSAAALLAGACSTTPAVTVLRVATGEKVETVQGDPVKLKRGTQETFAGIRGGFYVVRNAQDWSSTWGGSPGNPMPGTVDTARSMLVIAVAEQKDAVDMKIERVAETGNAVHVFVRETRAGEGCSSKVHGVEQTPLDAVVTPRIDKPLRFYVEQSRAETCGDPPSAGVRCRIGESTTWAEKVSAQPGDAIDCEMSAEARGKFALVDRVLLMGELPGGSSSKISYAKGPGRGTFTVDVFGTYLVRAEARDESGRKAEATATVEALPPRTKDVLVQLVWTNFDVSDDPETFPRVKLRASEDAPKGTPPRICSVDQARPEMCTVKTQSAYTHMRLKASDKRLPLDVAYLDERVEKGPLVCLQIYFDGSRTGESCDRRHRAADEKWTAGTLDMATGKLIVPGAEESDAGASDGGSDTPDAAPSQPAPKPAAKPPAKK